MGVRVGRVCYDQGMGWMLTLLYGAVILVAATVVIGAIMLAVHFTIRACLWVSEFLERWERYRG